MKASPYLLSPAQDYLFIAASPLVGFIALALMAFGVVNLAPVAWIMLLVFEGSHVFATWTRSILDPEHREKLGWKRLALLPLLCLIPPIYMAQGKLGQTMFFALTVLWLHTHIAKQHVGFLALYKRKAGELHEIEHDTKRFKAMLYFPIVGYLLHGEIGMTGYLTLAAAALVFLARFIVRDLGAGRSLLDPKLVLVVLTVLLQWAAFGYAAAVPGGIKTAGVVIVMSHVAQYHRLMVGYHQEDAKVSEVKKPWHSILGYAVVVLMLNWIVYVIPKAFIASDVIVSGLWGMLFFHYLCDSWIWKTKDFPVFRQVLRV